MLLATLTVLPALVVIVGTQWLARQRAMRSTIEDERRTAHAAAAQQATIFTGTVKLLQTLADARVGADREACNATLGAVQRHHSAQTAVFVLDGAGTVVCPIVTVTNNYADREWFQRAIRSHTAVLSDFQVSRFSGKPDVVMALPDLDASGSTRYVYAAALDLRELTQMAARAQLPPASTLTVLDRHHTVLARYPGGTQWIGKRAPASGAIERIAHGAPDDVREDDGIDRMRRVWTTVPIAIGIDAGLILAIGVPHEVAFAAADDLFRRSAILLVGVIGITMAAGWTLGDVFVLRPMGTITDVIRRLARGDLTARARLAAAVPGLRVVTEAINEMAEALAGRERDQQQLQLLGRAIESTNDLVSVTDLDNRFTFVNDAFLRVYGYTRDEVLGRTPAILQATGTPAALVEEIRSRTEAGGWQGRLLNRRKDGTELPITLNTSLVRADDGRIIGLLGIARDISAQLRAEEALRETQERLRFALAASRVGIWEGNLKTRQFYWSEIQEALHGVPKGTFTGTLATFFDCIHPDDRERVRGLLKDASEEGREIEFEYRTVWPDGAEHWIQSSAHYVKNADGEVVRGAGVSIDVTERRSLEAQLRQAQKMEAVGQLAGGIAHDFNNMLTAIVGNAELVLDDLAMTDPHRADLEEIHRAGRRSAELTHQLLAFSRKQILAPRVLHVHDVIASVTPMLRRLVGEPIELRTVVRDHQRIKADPGQLEQVLVNLAVNARDAMPMGGVLTIESADVQITEHARPDRIVPAGSYTLMAVRDTGVGMDVATQARIFEPFFTTKPKGQGTGLGLATVYGIVKQSGGYILVSSAVGGGSCFSVFLPHTREIAPEAETAARRERPTGGEETILLVEDEDVVRDFTQKVLSRSGYTVHVAPTGSAAITFAKSHRGAIDLVLTDVVLPDGTGRQTAEHVRAHHPEAQVLFMSGYTDAVIVSDGVLEEGMAFLPKPFTIPDLLTNIRQVLLSSARPTSRTAID